MIQVNKLSKHFGAQVLFENITFSINKGERVGLVGRNGSGKSTLFKILLNEELPDSGEVLLPKNYKLGTLRQHLSFSKETVLEECLLSLPIEEQSQSFKAEKILMGLGFETKDFQRNPLSFSGGFQIRINLAKVLLSNPDCLLLDEPTNYLDIVSLRWLVKFLNSFRGEIILITHDRGVMDSITTHTMGIWRGNLFKIAGKTQDYFDQVISNEQNFEKERLKNDKKRKEIEDFVNRFRAKASKATQAQSRLKYLEKLPESEALKVIETLDFEFNFKDCPGKMLLEANNISFNYDQKKIFNDLTFKIPLGAKIGIIGKNGMGKSTLLNVLAGELSLKSGDIRQNVNLALGHFGQTNINRLNLEHTIEDEIASVNPSLSKEKVKNICGTMMFSGDQASKKIRVLSGGERARVLMGKLLANPCNLLLLDEPTNHLDQDSIESLILEIKNFAGSVVIVSHSENLLREVCDALIVFRGENPEYLNLSYDDFLSKIGWSDEEKAEVVDEKKGPSRADLKRLRSEAIIQRSKETSHLRDSIKKLEDSIVKMENRQKILEDELIHISVGNKSQDIQTKSQELGLLKKKIDEDFEELTLKTLELDELMAKWEKTLKTLET